jgi:hypothetical protein
LLIFKNKIEFAYKTLNMNSMNEKEVDMKKSQE